MGNGHISIFFDEMIDNEKYVRIHVYFSLLILSILVLQFKVGSKNRGIEIKYVSYRVIFLQREIKKKVLSYK